MNERKYIVDGTSTCWYEDGSPNTLRYIGHGTSGGGVAESIRNSRPATEHEVAEFQLMEAVRKREYEQQREAEAALLALCGLTHDDFCRFRGAWREDDNLFVSTRENGVDGVSVSAIRNPNYISQHPDDGDSTYETYVFNISEAPCDK
jgi:hypothetical protein